MLGRAFTRAVGRTPTPAPLAFKPTAAAGAARHYRHYWRVLPEDFELSQTSVPDDVKGLMSVKDPRGLGFLDSYWYKRIRGEANVLDPESLPKKSYKQLCRDMGYMIANPANENMLGLLELLEYLKVQPMVGPFGTIENPVIVPSITNDRVVACTGGVGDDEHACLWFHCREGFLYRCGECDQIFMLARVSYEFLGKDSADLDPVDPEVSDVFDLDLIEKGVDRWNDGMIRWETGHVAKKLMNEGLPDVVTFDEFKEIMFGIPKKSKHSAQDILDVLGPNACRPEDVEWVGPGNHKAQKKAGAPTPPQVGHGATTIPDSKKK